MNSDESSIFSIHGSLTKREFFAAMAMQGIVAKDGAMNADMRKCNALEAVRMADELLKALAIAPVL